MLPLSPIHFIKKTFFLPGFKSKMDLQEAKQIFNTKCLQKDHLDKVYKTLIINNHPDRNGSPFIMQKINEARKILMSNVKK